MRLLAMVLACLIFAPPALALSDSDAPDARASILHRIDLAGRQRMLSQRIAMSACLVHAGAEPAVNAARADSAEALFDRTQRGLRAGDAELDLAPESQADVLEALTAVERLWPKMRETAMVVREGGPAAALALTRLRTQAGMLLKATNEVVTRMEDAYAQGLVAPELAGAVSLAGRQRMLIQKAMMQACFAASSGHGAALKAKVLATKSLFEHSLANLLIGDAAAGVIPVPTPEIDAQLVRIVRMWRWLGADLEALASGTDMGPERLAQLARAAEVVLIVMNETVGLYAAL